MTLHTPLGEKVLANTPIQSQTEEGETLVTTFQTTPIMSTYLLAFAFGDIDYLERQTKDGITVRTWATPENVKHTAFALDVAVRCLEFYNNYFDIPYPLQKSDQLAVPDFSAGAMENWGLITYRESMLLVDPENTSLPREAVGSTSYRSRAGPPMVRQSSDHEMVERPLVKRRFCHLD